MDTIGKKRDKINVEFIGGNADSVTGSTTLISWGNRHILFEMGGIQGGKTPYDNYKLNRILLSKIKAKEIDMILVGHAHYDHEGNICSLTKQNPNIRVITGEKTTGILQEMWLDSANISSRDCEQLSHMYPDRHFEPYFTESDVYNTVGQVEEYCPGVIHKLDDEVSIRYTYSGHIFGAMQCEVFINNRGRISKISFSSDLGNLKTQDLKPFVQKFEPIVSSTYFVAETTYGSRDNKAITKKVVEKDLEKIKSVIEQFCKDNHRRVLMPVFSLDKCPNILWLIYSMFKDDKDFDTTIIVDSPLTNRLLDRYAEVLEGDAKEKFDEMLAWKNLLRITDSNESKHAMETLTNVCILSSGGMLQSGRSVKWAMNLLSHSNDCIIFSGYCGESTLGYKIKNCSDQKTISINGTQVKNRCQIVSLRSQSSHMQREDLLKYYSDINASKIFLVHGDMKGKIEFAEDLKKEISNKSKTTNVCVVNKGTTFTM